MKKHGNFILYLMLAMIIGGGVYLFSIRSKVAAYLQSDNQLSVVVPVVSKKIPVANTIDSSILNSPRLNSLTNNVVNFNFNNICWRPDTFTQPTNATGSAVIVGCRLGNGLPFVTKIK